jgi:hypothetical protein
VAIRDEDTMSRREVGECLRKSALTGFTLEDLTPVKP